MQLTERLPEKAEMPSNDIECQIPLCSLHKHPTRAMKEYKNLRPTQCYMKRVDTGARSSSCILRDVQFIRAPPTAENCNAYISRTSRKKRREHKFFFLNKTLVNVLCFTHDMTK